MNISRLAVLAVFFMMVMSAFVAVPAYNVSAEDHGDDDEHDEDNGDHNDDAPDFHAVDENEDGKIDQDEFMVFCPDDISDEECTGVFDTFNGEDGLMDEEEYNYFNANVNRPDDGPSPMMVCYDIQTHEIDFSITTPEACNEAGLMWTSANSGPNDGDDRGDDNGDIENFRVHIKMESLGDWLVTIEGDYPVDQSNNMREYIAQFCADMMGGSGDEITQDCYEQFLMGGHDDDHGDHGDHDEWHCPPGLTDDECDMMEDCQDNDMVGMSCQRMMYDYCNDNPNACGSHDDDGNFFYAMFAYEDGDITAEEFMSNNAIQNMFNDDGNDNGTDGGPSDDWGQGKYDLYTFTPEMDGNVKIDAHFLMDSIESPNFICGNGNEIPFYYVNNGSGNCEDGADEQWYDSNTPNDTSDDCQEWNDSDCVGEEVNWFDCHDGTKVWINQVNNGNLNCNDGEDEYHNDYNYWHGNIYLLSGEFMGDDIGTELTPDHVAFMKSEMYYCGWADDNKTHVDCGNYVDADLVAGDTYTLVTMGPCDTYDDEEMHCETGNYMHTMHMEDGTSMNMSGNVTYDHPMADFSEMMTLNDDSMFENFVLYDERAFTVGEDGFTGMLMTYGNACEDYDNDGVDDNCYGTSPALYLYEAFNSSDTESGLVGSAMPTWEDEFDCPDEMQNCTAVMMGVELTPGNYTIVTTFKDHHTMFMNMIQTADGATVSQWDGELRNAHFEHDENSNYTLVEGNDRIYMPYPEYPDYEPECYDEDDNVIDCDDMMDSFALVFAFMENMTAYEDGDMNATVAADNVLELLNMMIDNGFFDRDEDHDDHDNDDHVDWNNFSYCEWEGADWDGDMMWYCDDDGDNEDFEDYWYYCEEHDDSMDSTMFFCTDDFGQSSDYENSASNDHYVTGGRPDEHHDNDDHDDHGDHDDNDSDDNPAMLDGIVGVQDPQDAGDNCSPSADDPHLLGSVSDNEGQPLSCSYQLKISFEGVDNSLDTHVAYIPFEDEQVWTLKIEMLEGYEFISCDNCEVDDEGVMNGSGPVKITFAKAEPQPDCDYVVGLSADGMAFDPVKLAIKAGETVCWQWKDASMAHNVLELEGEYDSTMNLTNINFGFSSGEPSMTVDYRHTFTENDKVHYYVCEPHAQLGMVGQITVGNGTEDPTVQQALEDNEVPSIGFVVGSLVLIGAAGLRRRIH